QLRLSWDDLAISPQLGSEIVFPGIRLRFDNSIDLFRSDIARAFPAQCDNFERLIASVVQYDDLNDEHANISARSRLSELITDPLLIAMLLCPLIFYGPAREKDMDWGKFSIMFRSIFLEGLGRPHA